MQEFSGTARFEIVRYLGRGGFGVVYEAHDRDRGDHVALKVLHSANPAALYRFKREFRSISDMAHPNVVALDELFTDGNRWFFTMELVDGQPFVDYVRRVPTVQTAPPSESRYTTSMLCPDEWEHVSRIYDAALEREPVDRGAFVDRACAGDEKKRRQLHSLLRDPFAAEALLQEVAVAFAAELLKSTVCRTGEGQIVGGSRVDRLAAVRESKQRDQSLHTQHESSISGDLDIQRLRDALRQLAQALAAIHRQGIVHRDIKPSNVLITADGRVVLLDFGVATAFESDATRSLAIAGTPAYMAPEHAFGTSSSPASDWYSVGVMMFEAMTGKLPFEGGAMTVLRAKQASSEIAIDTTAPSDLLTLTAELLDPDPLRRPEPSDILRRLEGNTARVAYPKTIKPVAPLPALVGRSAHLSKLADAFDTVVAGKSVVVLLPGASGVGKSALIRQFVADVRQRPTAPVVISGRCHPRESVPYKAVDSLIDSLARYLERLSTLEVARLLPRDIAMLARLFPVLLRVEEIQRARVRMTAPADSVEFRRRAATALRELLSAISDRVPLVLAIDDLQWGDQDSAALLLELIRLRDPAPILLMLAYRSEDEDAVLVRRLRRALLKDTDRRDVRTVHVNELTSAETQELARRELAGHPSISDERVAEIAAESAGNSFFVHELVRHTLTVGGPPRLATVIQERLSSLRQEGRHVLTVIALSAQPPSASIVAAAVGHERNIGGVLRALQVARLVRLRQRGDEQEIDPYHERIRETTIQSLDDDSARHWHAQLADAWQASGRVRPDTLVSHFRGAGDRVRMAAAAIRAAEAAEQALAFDRAAEYYRLLVDTDDSSRQVMWHTRLGDALANAGRGHAAATEYLAAYRDARGDDAVELERRAAEQLIRSGYLNEAWDVLSSLLPKIGLRPPRTELGAFAGLVSRRFLLSMRGSSFRERSESEISRDELRRIDVLWSIGTPLSLVDLVRGNNLHLRGMQLVLRAGEPKRAVKALAALACASAIGGARHYARAERILERAKRLAERIGDPTSSARTMLAEGICHKVNGRWLRACSLLENAIAQLVSQPGVRWEIETARTLRHDTLFWIGEWRQLLSEIPARRQEAEDRGDLYSLTHVAVRLAPLAHLIRDEPGRARNEATTSMARWPSKHFDLQRRWEVCSLIEADLYEGRAADAWRRLDSAWPRLRWTLRAFQNARIEMYFYRARIALACAAAGESEYLKQATRDASRLEREDAPWASALAALVRAAVSATAGSPEDARAQLVTAEAALRESTMTHYAMAARYRRAELSRESEREELATTATKWLADQGIANHHQIVNLLAPGRWR